MPKPPVRILLLEDVWADAELVTVELRKAGLDFTARRVATEADFVRALREFHPDLIIADHGLPPFHGGGALRLARDLAPAAPFIVLTGSLDDESALQYIMAGAADFILKDRLARIGPAVRAALERSGMQREYEQREGYFRTLIEQAVDLIAVLDARRTIVYATPSVFSLLGYFPDHLVGLDLLALLHPDDIDVTQRVYSEGVASGKGSRLLELRLRHRDGKYRTFEAFCRYLLNDPVVQGVVLYARDVTGR